MRHELAGRKTGSSGASGSLRGAVRRGTIVCAAAWTVVAGTGCANRNQDEVVLTGTTASQPNIPIVTSPTTPGPDDPLSPFEQRRLLARIQRDPQHQLQRLSARERRGLAAMAASTKKKNDDE